MFQSRPLTAIEALDKELKRLDAQMNTFEISADVLIGSTIDVAFKELLNQRSEIQKTLIELAKNTKKW